MPNFPIIYMDLRDFGLAYEKSPSFDRFSAIFASKIMVLGRVWQVVLSHVKSVMELHRTEQNRS